MVSKKNRNKPRSDWWAIYLELKELYMSVFKWSNLPESVNERYMEMSLMQNSQVCFFNDRALGVPLCLKAMNAGTLDVYGEPLKVNVYGVNGFTDMIRVDTPTRNGDGVLIYDNYIRRSPLIRLQDFAKRIHNIECAMDINVQHQKTPRIPVTDKDSELSMKTFMKQVDEGKETIVVDSSIYEGSKRIDMILAPAPFVADDLQLLKKNIWNEVLSFVGIINHNAEKSERLVADEIKASNGLALSKRNSRLRAREIAVAKINEKFKLDITVEVNNELLEEIVSREGLEVEA